MTLESLRGQLTFTANQLGFVSIIVLRNNCFQRTKTSVNSGTVHNALTRNVAVPWSPPDLEFSPCPLDDTTVGLRHHHNQSVTGTGSDSQSITGTYRLPLSGPTNHIFGPTVPSVSLSCALLSFPICLPRCWPLSHLRLSSMSSPDSVYLSFFLEKDRRKERAKYLKRKKETEETIQGQVLL